MMFAATPGLTAQNPACADCVVIRGEGVITDQTPHQFQAFLKRWGGDPKRAIVRLSSPGGHLIGALKLGRLMRERGLATEAIARHACRSACVFAFLGGTLRAAQHQSLGIHDAYFGRLQERNALVAQSGARQPVRANPGATRVLDAILTHYVREMIGQTGLIDRVQQVPSDRMSFLTASDIADLGIAQPLP